VAPPVSTYRVQVNPDFDLSRTAAITGYLAALGVSCLYTSPILQAAPGSTHGYDVVDHSRVSTELGGEESRQRLLRALRDVDLGLVVDIVPNHVGVAVPTANAWWWDLLRLGPQSRYARHFDIDWSRGRIVLPVLGDGPDELDQLRVEAGELRYYEHRFPLAAGTAGGAPRDVHDRQHYQLVSWRQGNADINYRRFFAVSDLAAIRVEDPEVFDETHRLVLGWAAAGELDGIRVDHPDGLTDPDGYFRRLSASDVWIVAEKILEAGEEWPPWPVAGSTGYDALAEVDGVFVDPGADTALAALHEELAGPTPPWPELVHHCKLDVAHGMQRAEVARLARIAKDPHATDAIAELLACLPVYRTYLPTGADHLDAAFSPAAARRPDLADTLRRLRARLTDSSDELAVRFQQQSGAIMAKGVEDTAYYRHTRFIAANEVGGDPGRLGLSPEEFHHAQAHRLHHAPVGMTTLSTHDTKRSEDVRARLAVLSEMTDEWAATLRRWQSAAPIPDGSFANLLWQTVAGAWPIDAGRLHAYVEKAAREARLSTSWDDPDEEFESTLHAAVDRAYNDPALRSDIDAFVTKITRPGWSNSLGAKLVQLTIPGVPDVYQGTELWDNSLVDPDNRRPVDFDQRARLLAAIDAGDRPDVDASGAAKLLVTSRALRARRDRPECFTAYTPIPARGAAAEHALAFDRGGAITVATRLPLALSRRGGWRDTTLALPPGRWHDVISGRVAETATPLSEVLSRYPVALLLRS
jgi:(1->4)-alpha-D-glucan 1-alpha-D-glucosylmutase